MYKTNNRVRIMDYLQRCSDKAVSVPEITDHLAHAGNPVNKTTVYRYLDRLEEEGLVIRYTAEDGRHAAYQYVGESNTCDEHLHLKGLSCEDFLLEADACFALRDLGDEPAVPEYKAEIGLYMDHHWYRMEARDGVFQMDPVADLDVSILQDCLLGPVLGIEDPRTSDRISFIGGIRGTEELVRLVDSGAAAAAFAMYPTQMSELLAVADAGLLMPPKSTWFEPKLRSGIFIHLI